MPKFDFKAAKHEIAEINAIVETCPDAVKEKCFELLFQAVFGAHQAAPRRQEAASPTTDKPEKPADNQADEPSPKDKKLPPNVLAFMRRNGVTQQELEKLFMLDHEPLLPVYKIPPGKTAHAQLCKVMMVLLENGLLNNQLSAPYPELREAVKEDGLYDGNFNKSLKRNYALFKGAVTGEGIAEDQNVELTGAGFERLAEIVKELGSS
jgi:hypothetical protein